MTLLAFIHADVPYDWAHLRHFAAFAFNPDNWITNGSEQLLAILVGLVLAKILEPWLRPKVEAWWHRIHESERAHRRELAKSQAEEMARLIGGLHARMDALHDHVESATGVPRPITQEATLTHDDTGIAGHAQTHPYKTGRKPAKHRPELAVELLRTGSRRFEGATSGDVTQGITAWGMLGNDDESDCVPAATEHNRMSKKLFPGDSAPATDETLGLYYGYGIAAGEPPPTPDEGSVISDWLQYLFDESQKAKLAGDDIDEFGFVEITNLDPANLGVEALEFNGIILGVELTDDAQTLFPNSPWTVANGEKPDPDEGHGILLVKFAPGMGTCVTWAKLQEMTYDWMTACVVEAWGIATREDAENTGLDFDAVLAAIKAGGGTVVDPPVSPSPAPEPAPSPSPGPPSPGPVPDPTPGPAPSPSPSPGPSPSPSPSPITQEVEEALVVIATFAATLPEPFASLAESGISFIEKLLKLPNTAS